MPPPAPAASIIKPASSRSDYPSLALPEPRSALSDLPRRTRSRPALTLPTDLPSSSLASPTTRLCPLHSPSCHFDKPFPPHPGPLDTPVSTRPIIKPTRQSGPHRPNLPTSQSFSKPHRPYRRPSSTLAPSHLTISTHRVTSGSLRSTSLRCSHHLDLPGRFLACPNHPTTRHCPRLSDSTVRSDITPTRTASTRQGNSRSPHSASPSRVGASPPNPSDYPTPCRA